MGSGENLKRFRTDEDKRKLLEDKTLDKTEPSTSWSQMTQTFGEVEVEAYKITVENQESIQKEKSQSKCWGCGKMKAKELQDPCATKFDVDCKKIGDRLYGAARRQNNTAWLTEQFATEKNTLKVFTKYRDAMNENGGKPPRPGLFVATLKEYMKTEQSVHFDRRGVMMDVVDFVEWAKTRRGGNIQDPEVAIAKFKERLNALGTIRDKDRPGGSDQVCVQGASPKEVLFRSSVVSGKEQETSTKHLKKATSDDIAKMQNTLLTKHDEIAGEKWTCNPSLRIWHEHPPPGRRPAASLMTLT